MASAYSVKGPGFTSRWRQQFIKFINVCSVQFDENKAPNGANLKKKKACAKLSFEKYVYFFFALDLYFVDLKKNYCHFH